MSQKVPEQSNVKTNPAPEQKKQEPPISDVSPDDPIGITSGDPSKGQRER